MWFYSFVITLLTGFLLISPSLAQRVQLPRGMPEYFRAFRSYQMEGNITRVELTNGLTLLVEELPVAPVAAIVTCFKVGHFDSDSAPLDPEVFSEALLSQLSTQVAPVGGVGQVGVDSFHTFYTTLVPEDNLSKTLEIHKSLFQAQEFNEKDLASARRIVAARRQKPNLTWSSLHSKFLEEAGGGIGIPNAEANPGDAAQFREKYYSPGNAVIVVTGAARSELVLRRVADLFAPLPTPETSYKREEKQAGESVFEKLSYTLERSAVPEPLVFAGFRTPGMNHSDYLGIRLIRYILGEGNAGLLRTPVELGKPNRFEFTTLLNETRKGTFLTFSLSTKMEDLELSESRFIAAARSIGSGNLPPLVINRAKALLLIDHYTSLGSPESRAHLLAQAEAWGDYKARDRIPRELAEISPQRIRDIARKYLQFSNLQLVEYIPNTAEERNFTAASFSETMEILIPAETSRLSKLFELIGPEDEKFEIPDFEVKYDSKEMRRSSVLRGPEVYLREDHTLPVVRLGIFFSGGRIEETDGNSGITDVLLRTIQRKARLQDEGVGIFRLERLGCRFEYIVENDFFGMTASVLSSNLEAAFPLLVGLHRDTTGNESETKAAIQEMIQQIYLDRDSTNQNEEKAISKYYGSHPYGAVGTDRILSIRGLDPSKVQDWREKTMISSHPYILVSGDVEGTSFLNDFVSSLSDSSLRVRRAITKIPVALSSEKNLVAELKGENSLTLVFKGPEMGSNFREMADIAGILLGGRWGYLYRRLEEMGTPVDNISVRVINEISAGAIIMTLYGDSQEIDQAFPNVQKLLGDLPSNGFGQVPFLNAKVGAIMRSHLLQLDPAEVLEYTMKAVLAGETADYATNYILNIRQIRSGEVESAVRRYLGTTNPSSGG